MEPIVCMTKKIKDGEMILKEGDDAIWAFYAYVLKSGRARVVKTIHDKPVVIGILNKGDVFGEMAFLGGANRIASVIADGDVEVEMIAKDTFMEVLDQLPEGVRAKLRAMVNDLASMTEIQSRLMAYLNELHSIREKLIDLKSLETEIEKMPELLRRVVIALVKRLNTSIETTTKFAAQAEEAVRAIDSLSLSLLKTPLNTSIGS